MTTRVPAKNYLLILDPSGKAEEPLGWGFTDAEQIVARGKGIGEMSSKEWDKKQWLKPGDLGLEEPWVLVYSSTPLLEPDRTPCQQELCKRTSGKAHLFFHAGGLNWNRSYPEFEQKFAKAGFIKAGYSENTFIASISNGSPSPWQTKVDRIRTNFASRDAALKMGDIQALDEAWDAAVAHHLRDRLVAATAALLPLYVDIGCFARTGEATDDARHDLRAAVEAGLRGWKETEPVPADSIRKMIDASDDAVSRSLVEIGGALKELPDANASSLREVEKKLEEFFRQAAWTLGLEDPAGRDEQPPPEHSDKNAPATTK